LLTTDATKVLIKNNTMTTANKAGRNLAFWQWGQLQQQVDHRSRQPAITSTGVLHHHTGCQDTSHAAGQLNTSACKLYPGALLVPSVVVKYFIIDHLPLSMVMFYVFPWHPLQLGTWRQLPACLMVSFSALTLLVGSYDL